MKFLPRLKLWLSAPADRNKNVMGDGKWLLLKAVHEEHSLKKAAAGLKISYRKAWGELKKCEAGLGRHLLEKHRGGAEKGETLLTPLGVRIVTAYTLFREESEAAIAQAYQKYLKELIEAKEE